MHLEIADHCRMECVVHLHTLYSLTPRHSNFTLDVPDKAHMQWPRHQVDILRIGTSDLLHTNIRLKG